MRAELKKHMIDLTQMGHRHGRGEQMPMPMALLRLPATLRQIDESIRPLVMLGGDDTPYSERLIALLKTLNCLYSERDDCPRSNNKAWQSLQREIDLLTRQINEDEEAYARQALEAALKLQAGEREIRLLPYGCLRAQWQVAQDAKVAAQKAAEKTAQAERDQQREIAQREASHKAMQAEIYACMPRPTAADLRAAGQDPKPTLIKG